MRSDRRHTLKCGCLWREEGREGHSGKSWKGEAFLKKLHSPQFHTMCAEGCRGMPYFIYHIPGAVCPVTFCRCVSIK